MLPQESGATLSGSTFLPPCRTALPCEQYLGSAQDYVNSDSEVLVFSKCVPVAKITDEASALVTSLANNTLYRVAVIPTDRNKCVLLVAEMRSIITAAHQARTSSSR